MAAVERNGMLKSWPGYLPPLVAAAVTLILAAAFAAVTGGSEVPGPGGGVLALLLIPVPLGVAVLWGSVLVTGRSDRFALAGALVWLVVSYLLLPRDVVWQLAANVAAGLMAGRVLGLRLRLDAALVAVALTLLPVIIWSVGEISVDEQLDLVKSEMLTVLEDNLPAGASEEQRAQALAEESRNLDRMAELAARIYPFVIGMGLLGQAGVILALVWFAVRPLGFPLPGWGWPPFARWRVPFYLVWMMVAGIGLLLTRRDGWEDAGLNLVLLTAGLLSVQGIAVQWFVTSRMLSKTGRLLYWLVMGVFFAPLILISGVVLGLVDQWVDLRRLGTGVETDERKIDDTDDME